MNANRAVLGEGVSGRRHNRRERDWPHEGDCIDTLCTACGCCGHCVDDEHCDGTPGCAHLRCGCAR